MKRLLVALVAVLAMAGTASTDSGSAPCNGKIRIRNRSGGRLFVQVWDGVVRDEEPVWRYREFGLRQGRSKVTRGFDRGLTWFVAAIGVYDTEANDCDGDGFADPLREKELLPPDGGVQGRAWKVTYELADRCPPGE